MFNINKFYLWLDNNTNTPFKIKIKVLDTCLFTSLLYGVEAWWNIDIFSKYISKIERQLLKRILCIKDGTPNDIVYLELDRPTIIARIKNLL